MGRRIGKEDFANFLRNSSVLIVLVGCLIAVQNAAGQRPDGHVEQYLDSVEVCSATSGGNSKLGPISPYLSSLTKKKIRLANFPNNTVVVRLTRWDQMWKSFYNFRCQFAVTAPKKQGVLVSIQALYLRPSKGAVGQCRDYVRFKFDEDAATTPICGELARDDKSPEPLTLHGRRFVSSSRGEVDVIFNTGNSTLHPEEEEKPLAVEIVFTATQECSSKALEAETVKQCSSVRKLSCIPKSLWCDRVLHCGFDEDFGADERECADEDTFRLGRDGKRQMSVYVFAVAALSTLIAVIFFVFLGCCCIRRLSKPPRNAHFQRANVYDTELSVNLSGSPTAPPLTIDRNASASEKPEDLPPSYDALFPCNETVKLGIKKK